MLWAHFRLNCHERIFVLYSVARFKFRVKILPTRACPLKSMQINWQLPNYEDILSSQTDGNVNQHQSSVYETLSVSTRSFLNWRFSVMPGRRHRIGVVCYRCWSLQPMVNMLSVLVIKLRAAAGCVDDNGFHALNALDLQRLIRLMPVVIALVAG